MMDSSQDLYQIALLIDQLRHEDPALRVAAASRLEDIAKALGPERTRDELIPFLAESLDDEDEVLVVIADKLGALLPYIGGTPPGTAAGTNIHAGCILLACEAVLRVAGSGEVGQGGAVRDAAVRSASAALAVMTREHLGSIYIPMLSRLAQNEWYSCRMSAASLFVAGFGRLQQDSAAAPTTTQAVALSGYRSTALTLFLKLCTDETPMVRRLAALHFPAVARLISTEELVKKAEIMAAFAAIADDEQDSVRIQAIAMAAAVAEALPTEMKMSLVLPKVLNISSDGSWRVRWALANKMHDICRAFGPQISNSSLASAFEGLLNDGEAEVRSAAAAAIVQVSANVKPETVISLIIPAASRLCGDMSEHVRCSVALVLNGLGPVIGRQASVQHLLPMLLLLLRDESAEVRLNIISSLDTINAVIGVDLLRQSLLPAILELADDAKWRVRLAIIESIPMLAMQLGKGLFTEKLNSLCMNCLSDDVYSVRRVATANLEKLSAQFGAEWTLENILPQIEEMSRHKSFSQRMTSLYAVQALLKSLPRDSISDRVVPLVLRMAHDPVPNVRFTVAKALAAAIGSSLAAGAVSKGVPMESEVLRTLGSLGADSDKDVRFYASKAMEESGLRRALAV